MVDPNPVGGRDPASDPVALTVATYDRVAGAYVRLNGDPRILADARERFATAIAGAAPPEHYRILDAGCGPGRDSKWFAERGFQVVGVDLSAGMLAEAPAPSTASGAPHPSSTWTVPRFPRFSRPSTASSATAGSG